MSNPLKTLVLNASFVLFLYDTRALSQGESGNTVFFPRNTLY